MKMEVSSKKLVRKSSNNRDSTVLYIWVDPLYEFKSRKINI